MAVGKSKEKLLEVKNLKVSFGEHRHKHVVVNDVSFDIYKGETFGLVGESGSGKTTIGRSIIRINPTMSGDILFHGEKINGKISKELDREITTKIQMIFQDPIASLNERAKVDYIVSEGLLNRKVKITEAKRKEMVDKALLDVGLLPEFSSRFPHEFSGGQRQRIGIARALIMEPEFIIADEPISTLDVSIIAHDLSVMRFIADRIAVIHKGVFVEMGETEKIFTNPLHPYTKALLSAVPMPDPIAEKKKRLTVYDPSMHDYSVKKPKWVEIEEEHFILGNDPEIKEYRKNLK